MLPTPPAIRSGDTNLARDLLLEGPVAEKIGAPACRERGAANGPSSMIRNAGRCGPATGRLRCAATARVGDRESRLAGSLLRCRWRPRREFRRRSPSPRLETRNRRRVIVRLHLIRTCVGPSAPIAGGQSVPDSGARWRPRSPRVVGIRDDRSARSFMRGGSSRTSLAPGARHRRSSRH
jgi:hypothetical protein